MTTWLTWIFLESPAALLAVTVVVLFTLLVYWRRGGSVRPLFAALLAACGMLITQSCVMTQREHAGRILSAIVDDLCDGRVAALAAALSPRFRAADMDRERFAQYVGDVLERVRIHAADRTGLRLAESRADAFRVVVGYLPDLTLADEGRVRVPSSWSLAFERDAGEWKITEIICIQAGPLRSPTWQELRR
ncbi:hypothetical protein RAS1_06850 [Phycisphaerae bacterium RAS1]|nr:hypothetical protein RAS1_06850 [Phycisphaerae bacterium RAS1]